MLLLATNGVTRARPYQSERVMTGYKGKAQGRAMVITTPSEGRMEPSDHYVMFHCYKWSPIVAIDDP